MENFKARVREWLQKNDFDCDIEMDTDFGYDWGANVVHIGTTQYPEVGRWYKKFMFKYGLAWSHVTDDVMCMIHELGHYSTIERFTDIELLMCQFVKSEMLDRMENPDTMFKYWEMKDEFAANCWAIDFINYNIEAVNELIEIFNERSA